MTSESWFRDSYAFPATKLAVSDPGARVRFRDDPECPRPWTVKYTDTRRTTEGAETTLTVAKMVRLDHSLEERIVKVFPSQVFIHPDDEQFVKPGGSLTVYARWMSFQAEHAEGKPEGPKPAEAKAEDASPNGRWRPMTPQGRDSVCGRFRITYPGTGLDVEDLWTGEKAPKLPTTFDVEQWCDGRRKACKLLWECNEERFFGRHFSLPTFEVYQASTGRWHGVDPRFPASVLTGHMRVSPAFDSAEQAQNWCAVRAACVVEGGEHGDTAVATLRYEAPVPF